MSINDDYTMMQVEHKFGNKYETELFLASTEITTVPELFKQLLLDLREIKMRSIDTSKPTVDIKGIPETATLTEVVGRKQRGIETAFILNHAVHGILNDSNCVLNGTFSEWTPA
jgi:hypothetical protein